MLVIGAYCTYSYCNWCLSADLSFFYFSSFHRRSKCVLFMRVYCFKLLSGVVLYLPTLTTYYIDSS